MSDLETEQTHSGSIRAPTEPDREIQELKRELALQSAILQSCADPLFLLNSDGSIFLANLAAMNLFGGQKGLLGRDFSERILAPIFQETFRLSFGRLVATDAGPLANRKIEVAALRSDRSEFPIELKVRPLRVHECVQYVVHLRDISEFRKTESLLRESEARFRRLFDSNMSGIYFWDFQGNISEANDCFLRLFGYTRKDIATGKVKWKDLAPPGSEAFERRCTEDLQRAGVTGPHEVDYIHKDGRRLPVLMSAALLDASRTRGATIAMDISTRSENTRLLKDTNAKLMALLDHLPMLAWIKDKDHRFRLHNRQFARTVGTDGGNILGKTAFDLGLRHAELNRISDDKVLLTGEANTTEFESVRDGEARHIQLQRAPLRGPDGQIEGILGIGLDITVRKRLAREHKISQNQLKLVSESVVEAVLVHDVNGRATFANTAAKALFGGATDWEQLSGAFEWLTIDGKPLPETRRPEKIVAAGAGEKEELLRLRRNGAAETLDRWLVQKSVALQDSSGALTAVLTIFRDVTEIRRLEDLNQQQTAAMRASMDGLSIQNAQGEFVYVNKAHIALFGYSLSEIIGKPWHILYDTAERNWIEKEVLPKFKALGSWRGEVVGRKKNGTRFYIEISMISAGNGTSVCAVHDVTEQKKKHAVQAMFEELGKSYDSLESPGTLRSLAKVACTYLADWCCIDLLQGESALNRVAVVARDSMKADSIGQALVSPPLADSDDCIATAFRTGKPVYLPEIVGGDDSFQHPDFLARSAICVPLMARNHALGVISFVRSSDPPFDLQDLAAAQELARRAAATVEIAQVYEKTQQAMSSREDFVRVLGHDLKNPLSAILLNASFLIRSLDKEPQLSERELNIRQQLKNLERSAARMNQHLSDYLDLAQIESGRLRLDRHEYRIGRVVTEAAEDSALMASGKAQKIETSLRLRRETAFFDRDRIHQAITALLKNAIRFTPEHGLIQLTAEETSDSVLFSVQDSDLESEYNAHVFGDFRQLNSRDRISQGLGLPLAKGIIEAHGGKLWSEKKAGQGCVFHFTLPLQSEDPIAGAP